MEDWKKSGAPKVKTEKILHLAWHAEWRADLYLQGRRRKFLPHGVRKTALDVVHLVISNLGLQVGFSKAAV